MVDVDTALMSAAMDGRKSKGKSKGDSDEKKRPGGALGIEPFEPAEFHAKEKADTVSMWLVLVGSSIVALSMRYILMPSMDGPATLLWLLPMLLVGSLPPLHRLVLPSRVHELYTFGNWFRASFLWIFTWLSISILLVNPPLGDISPPEFAAGPALGFDGDGVEAENWTDRVTWTGDGFVVDSDGSLDGNLWLLFGISDNTEPLNAKVAVRLIQEADILTAHNGSVSSGSAVSDFDALISENQSSASPLMLTPHPLDVGIAYDLGQLAPGEYRIEVDMEEQGDPWINKESPRVWTLIING